MLVTTKTIRTLLIASDNNHAVRSQAYLVGHNCSANWGDWNQIKLKNKSNVGLGERGTPDWIPAEKPLGAK